MTGLCLESGAVRFIDDSLAGEVVFLRGDCNVPLEAGVIADDSRLVALIPTIKHLLSNNKVILASHLGRPKGHDVGLSMKIIAEYYACVFESVPVVFCSDLTKVGGVLSSHDKVLVVLENLRFYPGEVANDDDFARQLAESATIYVNDAFACSHRAHASVVGITNYLPSYGGLLLRDEIEAAEAFLGHHQGPTIAIVGGGKISTKAGLLVNLCRIADHVVVGGGIANYMLRYVAGYSVGGSLLEDGFVFGGCDMSKIVLPKDVVVAKDSGAVFSACRNRDDALPECREVFVRDIESDDMIVDIGRSTVQEVIGLLRGARMVVWNGPLGLFECKPFDRGSVEVGRAIASLTIDCKLCSLIGGGDTIRLAKENDLLSSFSHVSTGGGALLEFLSGVDLPGIGALTK